MSDFNNHNNLNEINPIPNSPQYTPTPIVANKKGFDIASLVLGITAIIPGCCCTYVGILLGILAIVFSVLYTKANVDLDVNKKLAKAGLILGIIGLVLCVSLLIFGLVFSQSSVYQEIIDQMGTFN